MSAALVFKYKTMADQEYVPEHVQDMIFAEYIHRLLDDEKGNEDDEAEWPFNPYSLDSSVPAFRLESGFKHGIKEPSPASKKLKPASHSMFECEFMEEVNGVVDISGIYAAVGKYIVVNIVELGQKFYVPVDAMKTLLQEGITSVVRKPHPGGNKIFGRFRINHQALRNAAVKTVG